MDCFYASCERARDPSLRDCPVVVGMGYEPEDDVGAVATASYEARDYGVESAMPISEALELLPRDDEGDATGEYLPVDMEFYESVSDDIMRILDGYVDVLRVVSVDEAYAAVGEQTTWEEAESYAREIKQTIRDEADVPASVGVAATMSTAKVASDYDKPDGLTVVPPAEEREWLAPLPVEEIHGIGPVSARKLCEDGIHTAGDLAEADPSHLVDEFGERGRDFYRRCRGLDDRQVTPTDAPKSLSRESSLGGGVASTERKRSVVRELAADVSDRVDSRGATYRTVGLKVVLPPFDVKTRERTLSGPIHDPPLLKSIALDLLSEFVDEEVRKVGVKVSNLSFQSGTQATLGDLGDATPASEIDVPEIPSTDSDREQSSLDEFGDSE